MARVVDRLPGIVRAKVLSSPELAIEALVGWSGHSEFTCYSIQTFQRYQLSANRCPIRTYCGLNGGYRE